MTQIPHNQEAEEGVIACCLNDNTAYDTIATIVQAQDFYFPRHQTIFSAISVLSNKGEEFSEIELIEHLKKEGTDEEVGGLPAIFAIQGRVDTGIQAKSMARIVKEKSKLRQIIRSGRKAIEAAEADGGAEEVVAQIEADMIELNKDAAEDSTIAGATEEVWQDMQAMMRGEYESHGLPFNIESFDDRLPQGMEPGTVTVIAAPTSCGKSQLAINIAMSHAIKNGLKAGYASFEMLSKQLAKRMLQVSSGVNLARIRDHVATEQDIKFVEETKDKLKQTTILTDHRHRNIDALASLCRQWKRKHNIGLMVIDYLQLLSPPNNKCSSVEAVAYNSRRVKALALDLQIPFIVLSQVNREAVKRLAFKPEAGLMVHDLIGGSAIECDADNVCIFWPKCGDADESRTVDHNGKPFMQMAGQFAKEREGTRGERFTFKFVEHKGRFH